MEWPMKKKTMKSAVNEGEGVLTVEEASRFLKISKEALYQYVRNGILPARKIGKQWRLSRKLLMQWLEMG